MVQNQDMNVIENQCQRLFCISQALITEFFKKKINTNDYWDLFWAADANITEIWKNWACM